MTVPMRKARDRESIIRMLVEAGSGHSAGAMDCRCICPRLLWI